MVVKWSASLPSIPTIRVQIPLKPTVMSVKFVFVKNENKQKEAGVGPFLKLQGRGVRQTNIFQKFLCPKNCGKHEQSKQIF